MSAETVRELGLAARWLANVLREEDPDIDPWSDGIRFAVMHLRERAAKVREAERKRASKYHDLSRVRR
jgi:hypothetical protein